MTARQRIRAKPPAVQVVLKAYIVKLSIDDVEPDWPGYAERALLWWEELKPMFMAGGMGETAAAELVIAGLRKQDVWGKILRGPAS